MALRTSEGEKRERENGDRRRRVKEVWVSYRELLMQFPSVGEQEERTERSRDEPPSSPKHVVLAFSANRLSCSHYSQNTAQHERVQQITMHTRVSTADY